MKLSLWVVFAIVAIGATAQTQPMLKLEDGGVQVIHVTSINSSSTVIQEGEWHSILSVLTDEAYQRNLNQPVAGKYEWKGDTISFQPTYAFAPGEIYHAVFDPAFLKSTGLKHGASWEKSEMTFSIPKEIHSLTTVEGIYPESTSLPENLLRMYIHFSNPMMPGEAYKHIRLLSENGTTVEKAFLIIDQELWDTDRRRFTLLFDPGRIKRELKSNVEMGTPLREGEKYRIVIDAAWRDVYGNLLENGVAKTFTVSSAERSKVSPGNWEVIPPASGSHNGIVISFDRPMDHALALKSITIKSQAGIIAGGAEMINDRSWKFTPRHPWVPGEYVVAISPLLEDVAGNNLNNVFDLDLSKDIRVNSDEPIEVLFTVGDIDR